MAEKMMTNNFFIFRRVLGLKHQLFFEQAKQGELVVFSRDHSDQVAVAVENRSTGVTMIGNRSTIFTGPVADEDDFIKSYQPGQNCT